MKPGVRSLSGIAIGALFIASCTGASHQAHEQVEAASLLLDPDAPEMNRRAPELFHVRLVRTVFIILCRPVITTMRVSSG